MSVPNQYSAEGSRVRRDVFSVVGIDGPQIRRQHRHQHHQDQQRSPDGNRRMAAQEAADAAQRLDRRPQVRQRRRRNDVPGRRGYDRRRTQ
jgi:hypothetical protein